MNASRPGRSSPGTTPTPFPPRGGGSSSAAGAMRGGTLGCFAFGMSTSSLNTATAATTSTPAARLFRTTAIGLALSAAGYIAAVFTPIIEDPRYVSPFLHPYSITVNALNAIFLIALAVQLLTAWSDPRLPRWAVGVLAAGVAFTAVFPTSFATNVVHAASVVPPELVPLLGEGLFVDAMGWPKQVLIGLGAIVLAIVGKRRAVFGWPGAIGLILTGVVNALIWPFPPGALFLGVTFALLGSRPARS